LTILNLDNSISFISNKADSNRTLNIIPENDDDDSNLKQNKPILSNSDISLDEKSILSKSENDKILNRSMDDLDIKINDINKSFKNMSSEWHSTNAEFSERLNCLMWQMNQFQKQQTELSKKIENDVNNMKETINAESQKTINLEENIEQIKKDSENSFNENNIRKRAIDENYSIQQLELQNLNSKLEKIQSDFDEINDNLNNKIDEIKKYSENSENSNKIQKKETEENFSNQKTELVNVNSKLDKLQAEFKEIKEKVLLLCEKSSQEEVTPKTIDINKCDEKLIEYITKSVYEKIEQQYKSNQLDSTRDQNKDVGLNAKINELNEKLDEFQVYQLSREVEWYQMKVKLEDMMNKINKNVELTNNQNMEKIVERWNNENSKLKHAQEKINVAILDLQTTLNDVKTEIYESLNKQQNTIENISKANELIQFKNEKEIENSSRDVNDNINEPAIFDNNDVAIKKVNSLSDEIKILNMETKVMTTNISLLWEDVRSIKNFINQYDMNERLKEKESNDEYNEIRDEINNLKKIINEL